MSRYRHHLGKIVSPLPARVLIVHDELGRLDLPDRAAVEDFARLLDYAESGSDLLRVVEEGRFLDPDDQTPKPANAASQIRAMLLGTDAHLWPDLVGEADLEPDWLIKDLWERDTLVQASGDSKAGKTEAPVLDAARTLVVPGYEFFGRWPAGNLSPWDRERGVVLINTETPGVAIERKLAPLRYITVDLEDGRQVTARSLVKVYNLRDEGLGGPLAFNLFDPVTFEKWRRVLTRCDDCDGDDNWGPLAVIADNGTAVLRALRANVQENVGELQETFRALLEAIDTRSGIFVTHSTKDGSNALGGTEATAGSDGEWRYYTKSRGTAGPRDPRYWAVSPRTGAVEGIPETRVILSGGRPVAAGSRRPQPPDDGVREVESDTVAHDDEQAEAEVVAMFRAAPGGLTGKESTGGGGEIGRRLRRARDRLHKRGVLIMRTEGRQGQRWSLASENNSDTHDTLVIDLTGD